MAYEVRLAARAVQDLDRVYSEKQAETSPPAAEWFLGLRDAVFSLGDTPYLGPVTRENPDLRHLLYGNKPHIYRIIYSVARAHAASTSPRYATEPGDRFRPKPNSDECPTSRL